MVDRYLLIQESMKGGWTIENITDLSQLCYDMIKVISELRCNYSSNEAARRLRRIERAK